MVTDTIANVLYVGGPFYSAGGVAVSRVAKWDGSTWDAVGIAPNNPLAMEMYDDQLYIAGQPSSPTDTALSYWDGSIWQPVFGPNETVTSLEVYNNELYTGGYFDKVNSTTVNYIARYNNNVGIDDVKKEELGFLGNSIPNPAKGTVTIPYYLPQGSKGVIRVYGLKGELIKEYKLSNGQNELEMSLQGLSDGTYLYSIEEDGQVRDSKKMVIAK